MSATHSQAQDAARRPAALACLVLAALVSACATPSDEQAPGKPPHHTPSGFRNPHIEPKGGNVFTFAWMKYFGDDEWASYDGKGHLVPRVEPDLRRIFAVATRPQATWIGHSTVLLRYRGVTLLTDPMFSERASPLPFAGPRRETPPALLPHQLPPIDYVLISHNHYDHLDEQSVRAIGERATWFTPLGYAEVLARWGVRNVVELDWWESAARPGLAVTATPAQHWSARGINDRYRVSWSSWAVRMDDFKLWYAGDTGYNPFQFREIGERLGPFDLAIIPIGGYGPRWFMRDVHINPEEAVQVHRDVRARFSLGVQWGAFPLTAEPIDEPPRRLQAAAAALEDSRFVTVAVGETVDVELAAERLPAGTR